MTSKKWEETVSHAKKCDISDERYLYSSKESNFGLVFNSIYEVIGITHGSGQSFRTLDHLPTSEKVWFSKHPLWSIA